MGSAETFDVQRLAVALKHEGPRLDERGVFELAGRAVVTVPAVGAAGERVKDRAIHLGSPSCSSYRRRSTPTLVRMSRPRVEHSLWPDRQGPSPAGRNARSFEKFLQVDGGA